MKTQKGRSFIEMLAVLSIVALLGFSAYKGVEEVMLKNTTDNIWKELLVRITARRSHTPGNNNLPGFDNTIHGVTWHNFTSYDTSATNCAGKVPKERWMAIHIYDMDPRIVQRLLDKARTESHRSLKCIYSRSAMRVNLLKMENTCTACTDLSFVFDRGSR